MKHKKLYFLAVLFLTSSLCLFAQQIKVKGIVKDASGTAIPGVNIQAKNSKTSTSTNFDGNFQIDAKTGDILVFSYLGYKTQEKAVAGAVINIVLLQDSKELEGVVVTAMGVKSKSKALGYSSQSLKASDIDRPGQINALEALQGSVAGVTINKTSGAAGAGIDILIRGVSSLSAGSNNQPLIIVDGNPISNATSSGNVNPSTGSNSTSSAEQFSFSNRSIDINPDDIESYTVLKGAGATALYGILAGNGVIIITTKKGREGKMKINVSSSTTFNEVNKYPELQSKWREGTTAGTANSPFPKTLQPRVLSMNANTPTGVSYYPGFTSGFQSNGPAYSSSDDSTIKYRDFYRDFFKTGVNQTINFSLSGGNEKINYFVSASNSKDSGIIPNTDYTRKTFKTSANFQLTDNFKLGTSVTYANSGGSRANTGDKSIMSSMSYWSPSIDINDYLSPNGNQKNWTVGTIDNPRYFAEKSNLNDNVNRWIASVDMNWQAKPWLNAVYRASIDNYAEIRNRYVPKDLDVGTQVGGFIVNENTNFMALNSNLLLTANKTFGDFNTTLTVGNQILDTNEIYSYMRGEGILVTGINNISNTRTPYNYAPGDSRQRTVGNFAEAKVDYKEILYLSGTARRDEVSTLPKATRSFDYYSGNLAFVFSDLIAKESKTLSFGKLRASWAQVGKVPPYGLGLQFKPDVNFPFNGNGGISIGSVDIDPNIKAEIVTTYEFGTDLRFFKDRVRLEYTYFDRKSDDQIIPFSQPQTTGVRTLWTNAGSLKTTGHELTLGVDFIKNENFKWTSTVNFTAYETEVTSLPFEQVTFATNSGAEIYSRIKVGDAAGSLYGNTWTYVDGGKRLIGADGLPVLNRDVNGALIVSKVGNAFPDWVTTLNNSFKFKNVSLSFLLEYKKGGDAFDAGERNSIRNGVIKLTEERNIQKVLEGVRSNGSGGYVPNDILRTIDGNSYYRTANYNTASEILIQDASWFKIRNVALTYNLTNEVLKKLKMSNASISVNGGNFLVWTPFRGFDPEGNQYSAGSNTYGFTGLNVPLTQSYSLGINLGF